MIDAKELLTKLGIKPEVLEDKDATLDTVVEEFNTKQSEHFKEIYLNSDDYKGRLSRYQEDEFVKWQAMLDSAIKKSGLELTDDQKKLKPKEKIELLSAHIRESSSGKKDIAALQQELLDAKNALTELEAKTKDEIQKAFTEADKKVIADKNNILLKQKFLSIPAERIIGGKHNDGYYKALKATLDEKYDFLPDEKGELTIFEKGTQKKPTAKVDGKESFVSVDDILKAQLKELSFWVESNGQGGQQGQQRQQQSERQQQEQLKTVWNKTDAPANRLEEMRKASG